MLFSGGSTNRNASPKSSAGSEFVTILRFAAAHPETPVHIYENSGHGFNNDGRPDSDPDDAALARRRTLDLFLANGAG